MVSSNYLCPHCRAHLKPNSKIVLVAKTPDGKKGLMLLSPELGEYSVMKNDGFEISEGDILETFCPVCSASLRYEGHNELAKVILLDDDLEYDIIFSEIFGLRCTYKVHGESVEFFGEDADEYTNFWGETPRY